MTSRRLLCQWRERDRDETASWTSSTPLTRCPEMTIPNLLKLLFSTFPPPPTDDAEAQLAAYAVALDGHDPRDIEAGIRKLIRGETPSHVNKAFAPTAAIVGETVQACRDARLRHERLITPPKRLPEPEISPEERARVAAGFAELRAKMEDTKKPERVEEDKAYWKRVNDYFELDMSPDAVKRRLRIESADSDAEGDMGMLPADHAA